MQLGTEFVFVMPAGMVEKDEIPEGCGLYEVQRNQRIRRVKNGHQRGAIDWTPAMFHEVIRRMAFKKDTTYQMFSNRQNGSAVFRQIFKAYEKDWTFDELIGLTATLHRGLKFSEHEILQSKMDYDQRVMNDVAIQKAIEIQFAVQECCPWGTANSRDDFKRWFEQNKTPRLSQFTMTGLERVADALETHSRGVRIQIEKIREEMSNG